MDSEALLYEFFEDLPFLGPGDDQWTRRAFQGLPQLPPQPRILDVGCGNGRQTLELARLSDGPVTAVDIHEPFLRHLEGRMIREGLGGRITPVCQSMTELDFPPGSFDLIWSEGAVYIAGFENALREWKPFLARPGFFVCTHLSWLKPDPPANLRSFFEAECSVVTVSENLTLAEQAGYRCLDHFLLDPQAWWDNYYLPMSAHFPAFLSQQRSSPGAKELVTELQQEIDLYRKYSDYYGYLFYILEAQ